MNHAIHRDAPRDLAISINGVPDVDAVTGTDLVDEVVGWGVRLRRVQAEELADVVIHPVRFEGCAGSIAQSDVAGWAKR